MPIPLPTPQIIAHLLTELFDHGVTATVATAAPIDPRAVSIAGYRDEANNLLALMCCDLALGGSFGASLIVVPVGRVDECIKAKKLDELLTENLYEVFNVLASTFPKAGAPRLILREVHHSEMPDAALAAVLSKPARRVDLDVSVAGYRKGRLVLLAV